MASSLPHQTLLHCVRKCQQLGIPLTRYLLIARISEQAVWLLERNRGIAFTPFRSGPMAEGELFDARAAGRDLGLFQYAGCGSLFSPMGAGRHAGRFAGQMSGQAISCRCIRAFRCSTSRFGVGQIKGSNCTPLGLHRIGDKLGGGWPVGTVFKSRQPVGFTWKGLPRAKITSRILWLEGLEPGVNRGGNVDSHDRYIYFHGTGDEPALGRPASCGCVHLAADDLIPLFDLVPAGTLVWMER